MGNKSSTISHDSLDSIVSEFIYPHELCDIICDYLYPYRHFNLKHTREFPLSCNNELLRDTHEFQKIIPLSCELLWEEGKRKIQYISSQNSSFTTTMKKRLMCIDLIQEMSLISIIEFQNNDILLMCHAETDVFFDKICFFFVPYLSNKPLSPEKVSCKKLFTEHDSLFTTSISLKMTYNEKTNLIYITRFSDFSEQTITIKFDIKGRELYDKFLLGTSSFPCSDVQVLKGGLVIKNIRDTWQYYNIVEKQYLEIGFSCKTNQRKFLRESIAGNILFVEDNQKVSEYKWT
jgi:hypothetical protein